MSVNENNNVVMYFYNRSNHIDLITGNIGF